MTASALGSFAKLSSLKSSDVPIKPNSSGCATARHSTASDYSELCAKWESAESASMRGVPRSHSCDAVMPMTSGASAPAPL